jgi:transcriptional regulator with XRE-family HTH domain
MTTRKRKSTTDLRLKIAIIEARLTQRRLAFETRIPETRISEIVGRRSAPPSDDEKARIAKRLQRSIADLFEAEAIESDDQDAALADDAKRTA